MTDYTNKSLQGYQGKALTLLPADTISFTVAEFGLNNVSGEPQFSWDGTGTVGVLQLGSSGGNAPKFQFGGTGGSQDGQWELFADPSDLDALRLTNSDNAGRDWLNIGTDEMVIGNSTDETPVTIYGLDLLVANPDDDTINITGSLIISADLTVNGTTTTINTQTLEVEDNVIELAKGNVGDNLDIGWLGSRGSGSIGGEDNVAVFWDHANDTFAMATTDSDASTPNLDINVVAYAPLHIANINASVDAQNTFVGNVDAQKGLDVSGGQLTANAGGTFSGSTDWDFTGGNVHLNDSITLLLGTDDDMAVKHTGATGGITNSTGPFTIENTASTSPINMILGSTNANTWFQVQDHDNNGQFTIYGNGQVDVVTALNLPFKNVPTLAAEGNITYNSGTQQLEYHNGSDWVVLASSAGSTLQAAYEAGNTIDLAQADGDLAITLDDGPSAGAGIADFTVLGTGAENYIATDAVNSRILIGDSSIDAYMPGTNLLWTVDGGGGATIGAAGANRPHSIYATNVIKAGDGITIDGAAHTITSSTTLGISSGGSASDHITLNPGVAGAEVRIPDDVSIAFGDSGDVTMNWDGSSDFETTLPANSNWLLSLPSNDATNAFVIENSDGQIIKTSSTGDTAFYIPVLNSAAFSIGLVSGGDEYLSIDTTFANTMSFGNANNDPTFAFLGTGDVQVGGSLRLAEQSGDPTNVANTGFVFTKDDSGDTELYYEDDGGNVVQITADGFISSSSIGMPVIGTPTFTTLVDSSDNFFSSGRITGGTITAAAGPTFDVAAGTGYIRISNTPLHIADIKSFDWAASTGNVINDGDIKNVGIEYNSGSPQVVVYDYPYAWNNHDEFPLGTVIREGTTLHIQNDPMFVADGLSHTQYRFWQTEPNTRDDRTGGLILGETGTRNVTVSAGALWDRLNRFAISAIDTSGSNTFDRYYVSGAGPVFTRQVDQTTWDNTQYNNGTTLATMTDAYYAVQWFWLELDGDLVSMYGTGEYATLAEAENEGVPTTIPDRLSVHGTLIGRIIFQKNASTADEIQSVYTTVFSASAVADHGNLAGLADDDHTQYSLVNGSRAYTGGVNINHADGLTSGTLEVINLGTDGSVVAGLPVFTTAERDTLTGPEQEGWTIFNTTTNNIETWNGSSWEGASSTLQDAYDAGQTIQLTDIKGDMAITIDDGTSIGTGNYADFILSGTSGETYFQTDGQNTRVIIGESSGTTSVVDTRINGGLRVTDGLTGDTDSALHAVATVGDGISANQSQSVIYSEMTTSGMSANAIAFAVEGHFGSDGTDNADALLFGLGSIFTGLNSGDGTAAGIYVGNSGSEADYTAHILLNGGSQGDATAQRVIAFDDLVLQTFSGDVYLDPANNITYLADSYLYFQTDNTYDIGQSDDNRPAKVYVATEVDIGGNSIGSDGLSLTATTVDAADGLTISSGSSQDLEITSDAYLKMTAGASSDIWEIVQDGRGTAWKIVEGSTTILWVNTGTNEIRGAYPLTVDYAVPGGESIIKGTGTTAADADAASAINGTLVSGGLSGSEEISGVIGSVTGVVGDSADAILSAISASTPGVNPGSGTINGLSIGPNFDHDIIFAADTAQVSATHELNVTSQEDTNYTLANSTVNAYTMTIAAINSGGGTGDCNLDILADTEIDVTCTNGDIVFNPGSGSLGAGAGVVDVRTAFNLPFGQANEQKGNLAYNDGDDTLQYYNGSIWITLATGSGPGALDLQDAYENGPTITLANTTGDLEFIVDETPTVSNFIVRGSSNNYLKTDVTSSRLVLGDTSITVDLLDDVLLQFGSADDASINYDENGSDRLQFQGADVELNSNLVFGGAAYDIGSLADDAANGYRPRTIYTDTSVVVGATVTIDLNSIQASGSLTIQSVDDILMQVNAASNTGFRLTDGSTEWMRANTNTDVFYLTSPGQMEVTVADTTASAFKVWDGTHDWIEVDTHATPAITFGNTNDNPVFNFNGTGRMQFTTNNAAFNLPTGEHPVTPLAGDLRYNSGTGDGVVEFYDGSANWIELANATGSVTLQAAYDAGNSIVLADNDLDITLDAVSIGGDFANFHVHGSGGEIYILTQVQDGYIALGDGANGVVIAVNDTTLAWATDAGGDIGTDTGNRPDNIYAASSMAVSDGTTTVTQTEDDLTLTANTGNTETLTVQAANAGAGIGQLTLLADNAELTLNGDGDIFGANLKSFTLSLSAQASITTTTTLNLTVGDSSSWTFNSNDTDALTLDDGTNDYLVLNTTTNAEQVEVEQFLRVPRGDDVNTTTGPAGGGVVMADGDSGALGVGYITYAMYSGGETKALRADAGAPHSIGAPDQANVFGVVVAKNGTECQINTIHGMPVPVYFSAAPTTADNGQVVYLSTTPGEATLTAPTASETDVWQLGILVGADGTSTTPNVIWMPQFRYSNA